MRFEESEWLPVAPRLQPYPKVRVAAFAPRLDDIKGPSGCLLRPAFNRIPKVRVAAVAPRLDEIKGPCGSQLRPAL